MFVPKWINKIKNPKVSQNNYIPVYSPILIGNEKKYVSQCIDDGWLSAKGKLVSIFEKKFAEYCVTPYALACSSGTAALHLAIASLKLKPTDEVIVPSFTMIATAFAVSYTGAKVTFADCDPDTGNINIDNIEKVHSDKTSVVIPVDIYGCSVDIDKILQYAKEKNLVVVEDAAEAVGSEYKKRKVGSYGNLTAFSFYINKTITTGQGGILTTSSKTLYQKLKKLNNFYFSSVKHFWHKEIGYNYRMSSMQAAVGLAQLEYIDKILDKKREIAELYNDLLKPVYEYIFPLSIPKQCRSNHWQIAFRLREEKFDLMKLRNLLGKNGIETRSFFIPLHLQPVYYHPDYKGKYPNSELLAKTGLLLPSSPTLTKEQIESICKVIINYFKK